MIVMLPLKTSNPLNGSQGRHWGATSSKRKAQRDGAHLATLGPLAPDRRWVASGGSLVVTVTRIAPSSGLDPHDGLPAALKSVIDGVADALGLKSDRNPRVRFATAQERGKRYAVRVETDRGMMGLP